MTALALLGPAVAAPTDLSTIPLPTYSAGSTSDIKPNILFVLDDSYSMIWDFLPDWANDAAPNQLFLDPNCSFTNGNACNDSTTNVSENSNPLYLRLNADFNGVTYNPRVRYSPPATFTGTSGARSTRTSMTSANTTGWTVVPRDAYGKQTTANASMLSLDYYANAGNPIQNIFGSGYPMYYTTTVGEYCDSPALTNCTSATAPTGNYAYPAPLRWCSDAALTTCKAVRDASYIYPRIPIPRTARITFASLSNAVVSGITVDGQQIMAAGSGTATSTANTLATRVAAQINACASKQTGNCTTAGYQAYVLGSDGFLTLFAPGAITSTPVVTRSAGTGTITPTAFARSTSPSYPFLVSGGTASSAAVPGENILTVIRPEITSYTKYAGRSDCAGSTCTYDDEMTNYANWFAYYRTRMQTMKSSVAIAFSTLDSDADIAAGTTRFRVGYLSINNVTSSDFANVTDFTAAQKVTWYSKLFNGTPGNGGTPLRQALATAGRLFGGKFNGNTLNGTRVVDPLQYSCQRNFTILSTDGYWNGSAGTKLDGTTAVGNQDGDWPRPYNDGYSADLQARTSDLQQRIDQQVAERGTLQVRTSQLQRRTGQLQTRTRLTSLLPWGAWTNYASSTCTVSSTRDCQTVWTTGWTDTTSSCTKATTNQGVVTDCQYAAWTDWTNATATCNPATQSAGPTSYTVTTARQCQYVYAASAGTSTCTPTSANNSNLTIYRNCSVSTGAWNNVSSCTSTTSYDSSGNRSYCQYTAWTAWASVPSCVAVPQDTRNPYNDARAVQCQTLTTPGTDDTLADVAAYYYRTDLRSDTATGADATGTCTGPVIAPSTVANNLCTDNVRAFGRDQMTTQHMITHTVGLGAQGVMLYSQYQNNSSGQRTYVPDYWQQRSGDFYDVSAGSVPNTSTGVCNWQTTGSCTWPTPAADAFANIDDLWHAAINGRGTYFSASDPSSLASALRGVLDEIIRVPRPGTAAAAASSNPNVTSVDNYVFSSSYLSLDWYGELIMQRINSDGTLTGQQWSAMRMLDCATTPWTANTTYQLGQVFRSGSSCYLVTANTFSTGSTFDSSATGIAAITITDGTNTVSAPTSRTVYTAYNGSRINFSYSTLDATQQAWFDAAWLGGTGTDGLSQFCTVGPTCLSSTQRTAAAGAAIVDYLRGDRSNEGALFRTRKRVLGDIVSSEARYVQAAQYSYTDTNYSAFKTRMSSRVGTVYVGGNDGMLHAFDSLTGIERWAFVPPSLLPDMYRLADLNYNSNRRFYVDGTPEVGDICPNAPSSSCSDTQWKTILVGGLNLGGKAFYALDITDPTNPRFLWEFTHAQLGFSYSNPRITKLADGTWVVIVASGYNNADGLGRLFVLNANTGSLIRTIVTTAGSSTTPSGLARISARAVDPNVNNTVTAVYGGDVLGNLWRFDVNGNIGATGYDAQLIVQLADSSGTAQPITSRPAVASINNKPVIIVGTGRYLGLTDLANTQRQTIYAIKYEDTASATLTTPRNTGSNFVQQTLTTTTCPTGASTTICSSGQAVRTGSANAVDWSSKNGWYMDLPSGEMSFTDATLALGSLVFTTVDPRSNSSAAASCTNDTPPDALSYLYYMDYVTGAPLYGTNNVVGVSLGAGVATRPSLFRNQDGSVKALVRISGTTTTNDGTVNGSTDLGGTVQRDVPVGSGSSTTAGRRSWRILNGDN